MAGLRGYITRSLVSAGSEKAQVSEFGFERGRRVFRRLGTSKRGDQELWLMGLDRLSECGGTDGKGILQYAWCHHNRCRFSIALFNDRDRSESSYLSLQREACRVSIRDPHANFFRHRRLKHLIVAYVNHLNSPPIWSVLRPSFLPDLNSPFLSPIFYLT
jgi:hypothetical protein